ncbi:MAG: hypothetical protein QY314_01150 [Candidatus Dojkabacteria bacterium]|nr:MAG: hypothetical protein QY314_01150 [Candidatus Dojkabacteria bacterium]
MGIFYPANLDKIVHISQNGTLYQLDSFWKMTAIYDKLKEKYSITVVDTQQANKELFLHFHSHEFVEALLSGKQREKYIESCGVFWQPWLPIVMANRANATLQAVQSLLAGKSLSILISDAGHHTTPHQAFGFGPINSLGIALYSLQKELADKKVAILDLDTHRSNGFSFIEMPNVRLYDLWNQALEKWPVNTKNPNYVSREVHSVTDYIDRLNEVFHDIRVFDPDILIYYSGADVLETDRMHGIPGITEEVFLQREARVVAFAKEIGTKLMISIGGGYVHYIGGEKDIQKSRKKLVSYHLYTIKEAIKAYSLQ